MNLIDTAKVSGTQNPLNSKFVGERYLGGSSLESIFYNCKYLLLMFRAKEVLRDLKCVEKSNEKSESVAMGFGLGFRVMGVKTGMSCRCDICCGRCYCVCTL